MSNPEQEIEDLIHKFAKLSGEEYVNALEEMESRARIALDAYNEEVKQELE